MIITKKKPVILLLAVLFTAFYVFSFSLPTLAEDSVDEVQDDIGDVEKKLKEEEAKKARYESELAKTQGAISSTQYEINKTSSLIDETENTIARKEKELEDLNKRIEVQKEILARLVQEMYYGSKEPLLAVALSQDNIYQMLGGSDQILTLENKINSVIEDIKDSKNKIEGDKEELEEEKEKHEGLLAMKEDQKNVLLEEKSETETVIAKKEATISKLNSELSKLKSSLSSLLGASYDAGDIVDAAKFASKQTGVRKDFLLGMLVVESNLGRYTGGCTYDKTNMSKYREEIFKDIMEELGYKLKSKKLSCPPSNYKGSGGAMGVAQFMSDTWMGYKSSIASKTGHNPPDPWNLTDGVMGMALKLAKGGATSKSGECNAAKLYLSGGTSSTYNWYCDRVSYWADNYEDKF